MPSPNPPPITKEEEAHIRATLAFLHAKIGSWARVAKIVRSRRRTLRRVRAGRRIRTLRALARRLAKIVGVTTADLLAGRFPPPGTCPHCGR
jgi:hypothetical protein